MKEKTSIMPGGAGKLLLIAFCTFCLMACSSKNDIVATGGNSSGIQQDKSISGNYIDILEPDSESILKNPLAGWVLYANTDFPTDFWTNYDNISVPALGKSVKISDYSHTLYLRISWALLNPSEDHYGWNTNEDLKNMIAAAKQRGMKLAFRVVVDSRDKATDFTPDFVRDAGAKGYETNTGSKTVWSPYPDDPVFQEKYGKFIKAFAAEFNNPDEVEFIDGYGLGKWGEGHSLIYQNYTDKEKVFKWIIDLYSSNFTKIPLAINYHREIGAALDWGSPDPQSEELLDYAVHKGYILRHDAFGMTSYYQGWEKNYAAKWLYQCPVIMEGGWVTSQNSFSSDPRGYKTVADVRQGEFDDAQQAQVNMMDFRYGETNSWFTDVYSLVQKFNTSGAYRLYPDKISLPQSMHSGSTVTITHQWENAGWGYCPNNVPQWNYKYKVAFALLNRNDSSVAALFVDSDAEPSKWIKGKPVAYTFKPVIQGVTAGEYIWAVGIVDTTKKNAIGISLGAKGNFTASGWLPLFNVTVQ